MGGLFFFNSFRQEHDFEVFSHARGRNQVFELKRDLGALLGHVAIFKCVGELGALADAHQKLCLSDEGQMVKAGVFASTPQGGEVYLGCDVLLAWGLVRSALDCVLPEYGDRASMPASEQLISGIAVVDGEEKSSGYSGSDAGYPIRCRQSCLDSLPWLRLHAVAAEKFQNLG